MLNPHPSANQILELEFEKRKIYKPRPAIEDPSISFRIFEKVFKLKMMITNGTQQKILYTLKHNRKVGIFYCRERGYKLVLMIC